MLKWHATQKRSYLSIPWTNYVIPEPLESQEHVLYLVTLYLREIFTCNQAVDWSFKRPVATSCNCSHNQSRLAWSSCSCSCAELGCPKDWSWSGCAQKEQKTRLGWSFKHYSQTKSPHHYFQKRTWFTPLFLFFQPTFHQWFWCHGCGCHSPEETLPSWSSSLHLRRTLFQMLQKKT